MSQQLVTKTTTTTTPTSRAASRKLGALALKILETKQQQRHWQGKMDNNGGFNRTEWEKYRFYQKRLVELYTTPIKSAQL
jgi:hypothetical protein